MHFRVCFRNRKLKINNLAPLHVDEVVLAKEIVELVFSFIGFGVPCGSGKSFVVHRPYDSVVLCQFEVG